MKRIMMILLALAAVTVTSSRAFAIGESTYLCGNPPVYRLTLKGPDGGLDSLVELKHEKVLDKEKYQVRFVTDPDTDLVTVEVEVENQKLECRCESGSCT